ncbi:MAG: nuclear transport factor 2 family protein [Actinobacteria bacterium]|nr:nuclear transport factor 2 family protein [Actinomycetota bacterium]
MNNEHPARAAAARSMKAVEAADRQAWLANFTPEAIVEDPVGVSILDPAGLGHQGIDAIAAFWDANIGPNAVRFSIDRSYAAGDEVANVGTITTTLPDGSLTEVQGVFVYRVDEQGLLTSLRAFWEMEQLRFTPPGQGNELV